MRWLAALFISVLMGFSTVATAFDFDSGYYSLYEAPGSGNSTIIYIVPRSMFLLLASQPAVPLSFMPNTSGYQTVLYADGSLGTFTKVNYTANNMAGLNAVPSSYKLFGGDFNGDHNTDFLLQGTGNRNSVVLTTDTNGNAGIYYNFKAQLNSAIYTVNTGDTDLNGLWDVVAKNNSTGSSTTYYSNFAGYFQTVSQSSGSGSSSALVGSINGKFRVDESGNSTYSVDVLTAVGTAGVVPHISLNYSSGGGDGVMGTGWSIGGLSAITRCRQTPAQDNGNSSAITLSASDRFCLDGQRLILTSGTYGADGSTYRTEIDSYAVITILNSSSTPGNPMGFKVVRKDGSTSFYGAYYAAIGGDAQLVIGGKVLTWSISQFQDSVGNHIRYSYATDSSTNEQLISRVDYGFGSDNSGLSTSTTYLAFSYESRPDLSSGYIAGSKIQRTKRLTTITSYNNNNEIRHYTLSYRATDSTHSQSYVQQLSECVGGSCLSPTTFNWDLNNGGFQAGVAVSTVSGSTPIVVRTMDINGDGKADLVYMQQVAPYKLYYQLWNGSGYAPAVQFATVADGNTNWQTQVLDFDNDGYQDILVGAPNTNWILYRGTNAGLVYGMDIGVAYYAWDKYTPASNAMDFDGDGLPDYVVSLGGIGIGYAQNQRSAINGYWNYSYGATQTVYPTGTQSPCPSSVINAYVDRIVDYDGDGRVDIPVTSQTVSIYGSNCIASGLLLAKGNGVFTATSWQSIDSYPKSNSYQDYNGDGFADWQWIYKGNYQLAFNTGNGLTAPITLGAASSFPNLSAADYNADGYPDLIYKLGTSLAVQLFNPSTQGFGSQFISPLPFQAATSSTADDQDIFVDIDGDGHLDLLRVQNTSSQNNIILYKSNDAGKVGNKITSIDNGFGNTITINYKPLTDPSVYTKSNDANDASKWPCAVNAPNWSCPPVFDIVAPSYVVSSVSSTAPTANATVANQVNYSATATVSYQYAGLKLQASGRGSLGFASITTTDPQSNVITKTTYNQTFPFIGQPLTTTQTSIRTGVVFKSSTNTQASIAQSGFDGTKYYQIYTSSVTEQTKDPVGGWEVSYVVSSTAAPDAWGNVTGNASSPGIVVTTYASDHTTIVAQVSTYNTYGSSVYEQQFSRLSSATVKHVRPWTPVITRTSNFTYYGSGDGVLQGLLKTEQVVAGDGTTSPMKYYQYDQFGNKHCVSAGTDTNFATNCTPSTSNRYEITDYDSAGRFVVDKQSPFNLSNGWANVITEQVIARNTLGLATQLNGLNGLVTNYTYDVLGREATRSDNNGAALTTTYRRYGIWGSQYNVTTTANTGAIATQYFDALGRSIAKWQRGFDGSWIAAETEYDSVSRVKRQSVPHYDGATVYWTVNNYDEFRLQNQVAPTTGGGTATTSLEYSFYYLPLTITTNQLGQKRIETRNQLGELVGVNDNNNVVNGYAFNSINYTYDAAGQVITTTNTGKLNGATFTIFTYLTYDQLGRKIKMQDSDKGTWFYEYGVFGDLTGQYKITSTSNYSGTLADAQADSTVKMQITYTNYDIRGRMSERFDVVQSAQYSYSIQSDATWTYDSTANGVGQVVQEKQLTGGNITRTYSYDSHGRPSSTIYSDGNGTYLLTVAYDSYGRPYKNTDALGTGSGTINNYNQYGYLQSVNDFATNLPIYSVQTMDARGNVTSATYGNGTAISWIYDQGSGFLTSQTATSALITLQQLDYTWDALGNQISRWDRGIQNPSTNTYKNLQQSFCYDGLNRLIKTNQGSLNGSCTGTQDQQYDDFGNIVSKNNVGTYTYSAASPHQLKSTGDGVTYTYDTSGNLTADSTGRTNFYFVFDKAAFVIKGSNQIAFTYGADRNSYKRVDATSSGTTTTYYIGNVEKVIKADGSYDMKRYIAGVALWNHHYSSTGSPILVNGQPSVDQQYMYKDALGSVVMIADSVGSVKQQYAFNAWGERVDTTNWQSVLASTNFLPVSQQFTTHSFTGQDALDAVGLINYGGRIYDPRVARFIQADPFVQDGEDLQAYNRYAYVRNNPLTLTDPSGFSWLSKAKKHLSRGANPLKGWHDVVRAANGDIQRDAADGAIRALGPQVSGAVVGVASYWCGPAYAACVAAGNYEIVRAEGGSVHDALRAGAIAGASAYAFGPTNPETIGFQQAATMFVGDVIAAENPAMGQAFNFLAGGYQDGYSFQNFVGQGEKYLAGLEMERVAAHFGLTLQDLNIILAINSKLGFDLAGSTYNKEKGLVGGFFNREGGSVFERHSFAGVIWDINDSLLNSQGLLDAVSRSVVADPDHNSALQGHSLGAWRVNNLLSHGFISNAQTMSLPIFAYPVAGSQSWCVSTDPICGGSIGNSFRSGVNSLPAPDGLLHSHDWDVYHTESGQ